MNIGPVEHKTDLRFRNLEDFESYIKAIDIDYDNEIVIFTGFVYKVSTHHFNVVERNAYAKGINHMKESAESYGQNVYKPTSGISFIKFNKYFNKNSYTEEFRDFLGNEKSRPGIMTSARIHPSKKYKINIGCFDGKIISPRDVTEKNIWMFISINQLCSIWISRVLVSMNQ